MRNLILFLIGTLTAIPAFADAPRKTPADQELTKQETITLGNNRFLIFSGTSNGHGQYGYTIDLVKINDGIPHFEPLFIEEYNPDSNTAKLEYGIAFLATSYHFDKANNSMTYTMQDEEANTKLQLKYKLDVDIFKLEEVDSQQSGPCPKEPCTPAPPKTVFKASANAKAH